MRTQKWKGRKQVDISCDVCEQSERVRDKPRAPDWYEITLPRPHQEPTKIDICAQCYARHITPMLHNAGRLLAPQRPPLARVSPHSLPGVTSLSPSVTARVKPGAAQRVVVDPSGQAREPEPANAIGSVKVRVKNAAGEVVGEAEGAPEELARIIQSVNNQQGSIEVEDESVDDEEQGPDTQRPSSDELAEEARRDLAANAE